MDTFSTVSALNMFTLGVILLVAVGSLLWFRRKRKNRHPMEYANKGEEAAMQAHRREERADPTLAGGGTPPGR